MPADPERIAAPRSDAPSTMRKVEYGVTVDGRDPAEIERSVQFLPDAMTGDVAARGREFIAAGATHLIFSCPTPYSAAGARAVWEDVVLKHRA